MTSSLAAPRLAPLDTLRGFAALSVVIWHYGTGFGAMPMQDLLAPFYRSGGYAVIFFFLLSGYVLSHAYLAPQRRPAFARNLFARFARMAPLHYATLILVGGIQLWFVAREGKPFVYEFNDGWNFGLNLLFLQQSGLQTGFSFNGPSWSISVEVLVNVLFFALIAGPRRLLPIFLAISMAATALLLYAGGDLLYSGTSPLLDRLLLGGFSAFFWGAALYHVAPPGGQASRAFDAAFAATLAATLAMLVIRPQALWARFDLVTAFIAFPALVISALRGTFTSRLLAAPAPRWLGYVSFSLYLIHFPVQCLFHAVQPQAGLSYQSPLVLAAFMTSSLAAAYVVARGFEWPVYRLLTGRQLK
jgi:peptidoglycan/LPS O-acetylase OafA/YrhL